MEMGENDNFEQGNRTEEEDPMNYSSSISSAWRFNNGSINLTNSSSMGLVRNEDLVVCSSYSCTSLVDPTTTLWDQPTNIQNSGFRSVNIPENLIMKGGVFLPNMHQMPPPSLSQFPANSAFIERATRFPCFSDIATTPFNLPEPVALCPRGVGPVHGPHEAYPNNGLRLSIEQNIGEASKDVSMEVEASEKSPIKNDRRSESPVRSQDELKQGIVGGSSNGSDGAEFSGGGGGGGAGQDESHMLEDTIVGGPSYKGLGSKKSERGGQNSEVDQARDSPCQKGESVKDEMEIQKKEARTPSSTTNRATGKHFKQGSPASDPPKQEYIHVRARRGQATNSHSLAERVRREKISDRMKFLQDLVPGCSKVTGKAVMLDEIINYVQSLQRQVEFLSMKLATVNPWLDFNIEDLLTKDILQSRAAPSSTMAFTPEMHMPYPSLHQSPHGLIPSGLPCMGSASDILRRTINSQLMTPTTGPGFKEPTQLPNVWEDELHNAFQSFGTPAQSNSQDVDGSLPQADTKVEV